MFDMEVVYKMKKCPNRTRMSDLSLFYMLRLLITVYWYTLMYYNNNSKIKCCLYCFCLPASLSIPGGGAHNVTDS